MQKRSSKKLKKLNTPPDPSQIARQIVKQTTSSIPPKILRSQVAAFLGRLGGLKGGKARAEKLSPERRQDIARHAAESRWKRHV